MRFKRRGSDTPSTPSFPHRTALARWGTILFILCVACAPQSGDAQSSSKDVRVAQSSRPQPAEEDRIPGAPGMPIFADQQRIADPERDFALKMLESAEKELRLAERHATVATDAQMGQIAKDVAASRKREIENIRAWLANRKVMLTPRMLHR